MSLWAFFMNKIYRKLKLFENFGCLTDIYVEQACIGFYAEFQDFSEFRNRIMMQRLFDDGLLVVVVWQRE